MAQKAQKESEKSSALKVEERKEESKLVEFRNYLEESRTELKKVVWPTRKEVRTTCVAVLVLVFIMSLFLGLVDFGLSRLVAFILS